MICAAPATFLARVVDHVLVVFRVVADVAGAVLFLQAANAVHQPFGAWNRPWPGEHFVAGVGQKLLAVGTGGRVRDGNLFQVVELRAPSKAPRRWRYSRRRRIHDRGHQPDGNPPRFAADLKSNRPGCWLR